MTSSSDDLSGKPAKERRPRRSLRGWLSDQFLPQRDQGELEFEEGFSLRALLWTVRMAWERPRTRYAIRSLPAVVAGVVIGVTLVAAWTRPTRDIVAQYDQALEALDLEEESQQAVILLEKLCRLVPAEPAYRFRLAKLLIAQEQSQRGLAILGRIAPEDGVGYGPAHVWMIKEIESELSRSAAGEAAGTSRVRLYQRLQHHLESAISKVDDNTELKLRLAQLVVAFDPHRAVRLLEDVAEERPEVLEALAKLQAQLGEDEQAVSTRRLIKQRAYESLSAETPTSASVLRAVTAHVSLQEFEAAEKLIESSRGTLDEIEFAQAKSELYTYWARDLYRQSVEVEEVLSKLETAFEVKSDNPALVVVAMGLAGKSLESEASDRLARILEQVKTLHKPTVEFYLVLGGFYIRRDELDLATESYQAAVAETEDSKLLASLRNNLAWLAMNREPADLDEALREIEIAFATGETSASMFDTRGQILALQGKWREAIASLERSLGGGRADVTKTLETLVKCYRELGDDEMAQRYQAALDE